MKPATLSPATDSRITAPPSPTAATNANGRRGKRRRWTVAEKAGHVADFAALGLTQAEFCRREGLSPATFSLWWRQVQGRSERPVGDGSKQTFAEVVLAPVTGSAQPVVIHGSGGMKVEVAVGTDPVWLAHLLKALATA